LPHIPLTGLWGEAYAGDLGRELKKAGFDGVVITGKADHLVYLSITNGPQPLRMHQISKGRIPMTLKKFCENRWVTKRR